MTTWLHFIGRTYYATETKFVREARRFGITRRVSLRTFRNMAWGDRVLLAHKDGSSVVVFGQFFISKISGLSDAAAGAVARAYGDRIHYRQLDAPRRVERGCGSYTVTGEVTIERTTLAAVAAAVASVEDPGKLMVGGQWSPLFAAGGLAGDAVPEHMPERIRLKTVPFSQGFRPFAYDELVSEVVGYSLAHPGRPVVVAGQFYDKADPAKDLSRGLAELVDDYQRGSHWEQGDMEL